MILISYLHLAVLALTISAAPIHPSSSDTAHQHDLHIYDATLPVDDVSSDVHLTPRAKVTKPPKATTRKGDRKKRPPNTASDKGVLTQTKSLLPLLDDFDMITTWVMEGGENPADGTTTVPLAAMKRSNISSALKIQKGAFDPDIRESLNHGTLGRKSLDVTPIEYDKTRTTLQAIAFTKQDIGARPLSGELGLTQTIVQQLVAPTNRILRALEINGAWFGRGLGNAPIPDLTLMVDGEAKAVIEIKTIHSMTDATATRIMENIGHYKLVPMPEAVAGPTVESHRVPPKNPTDKDLAREKAMRRLSRSHEEKMLEQVSLNNVLIADTQGHRANVLHRNRRWRAHKLPDLDRP